MTARDPNREARSVQINLRVTPEEMARIDDYAARHTAPFTQMSRAAALRSLILLGLSEVERKTV